MFKYGFYKILRFFHLVSKKKIKKELTRYQCMQTEEYQVIAKSRLFDKKWYLDHNPDVKASKTDPIQHYLKHGWKEARKCTPHFDGKQYLAMYPDVADKNINPLVHWELYGKKEGRKIFNEKARERYLQTSNMNIYRNNILKMVEKSLINRKPSKILVHLHLYYTEQLQYFLDKLTHIVKCEYDLFVTTPHISGKISEQILKFKSDAKIIKMKNSGYDVWPFIQVIKQIDLKQYDFIIKLHTKAFQIKPNRLGKTGMWWRNELVETILADDKQFIKNLSLLKQQDKIGMICSSLMFREVSDNKDIPEESHLLKDELNRLGFQTKERFYCAGTMFMAKASVFEFLKDAQLSEKDFTGTMSTYGSGSLAHVYERILGIATYEKGYEIYPQTHIEYVNETIPVVYASDNNYMIPTIVSVCSLLENKKEQTKYDIIILHDTNISEYYITKLKRMVKKKGCSIRFIDMKNHFCNVSSQIKHITIVTYYRLLLPGLLQEYNKCIWLDGDTIVCQDLTELYNTVVNNFFIAGVLAPYVAKDSDYYKILNISDMNQYVNAGVLLWNLEEMRKCNLESMFLKLVSTNYRMMDQDILNKVCFGKIKIIPLRYNVMTKLYHPEEKKLTIQKQLYTIIEYNEAFSSPIIIHFCDKAKPWNYSEGIFFDIWRKYLEISKLNEKNIFVSGFDFRKLLSKKVRAEKFMNFLFHKKKTESTKSS